MKPYTAWFISGTDTEIGKTWTTLALLRYLQQSQTVIAMKPIASGCIPTAQGLRNDDALLLQQANHIACDYQQLNPYTFIPPIAPHLAAQQSQQQIDLDVIKHAYLQLQQKAQRILIEGVGGWRVPLSAAHSLTDLVHHLEADVILVVGLKLGCINHTLLSATCIQADGHHLIGWIANHLHANTDQQAVIDSIAQRIGVPLLGEVPYEPQHSQLEFIPTQAIIALI